MAAVSLSSSLLSVSADNLAATSPHPPTLHPHPPTLPHPPRPLPPPLAPPSPLPLPPPSPPPSFHIPLLHSCTAVARLLCLRVRLFLFLFFHPLPVLSSSSSVSCSSCSHFLFYIILSSLLHTAAPAAGKRYQRSHLENQWNRKWNIIHLRPSASFTPTCTSCPILWCLQAALFFFGVCSKL